MESIDRPKFGSMAVTLGFVGPEAVERALIWQDTDRRRGIQTLPIGDLLVRMGFMSREQQSVVTRALPRKAAPPKQQRPLPPRRARSAPDAGGPEIAKLRVEVAQLRAELENLTQAMIEKEDLVASLHDSLNALAIRRARPAPRFQAA